MWNSQQSSSDWKTLSKIWSSWLYIYRQWNSIESVEAFLYEPERRTCTGSRFSGYQGYSYSAFRERKGRAKDLVSQGVSGENHPQTVLQWETLFAKIANTFDNLPMAKGDTSNSSNLGYEIITPKRLKLGRNNYQSLEGSGIKLDMASNLIALLERNWELYCEWYGIFIENIHMLDLRPNKWLEKTACPRRHSSICNQWLWIW